ncbi:polyketide synthase Type III [Kitasatospora sp. MAA19]|uniref:3,5-dihydroxyphenylacetyl-CoA synthase DpgA n=1 Tax=Kitasatospora sp. MAA19 TaxID=3035090 RepID=UPI0024735034|nr:3,5-dihydroxyphenylacetyl-CoA synthase DpgA [Kitasatospora sp. MAA19]MDH6708780.1 polyketide synthase Type III [Kitasatospora sp. MAA19]
MTTTATDPARIIGVGTAVPANSYSQQEILDIFAVRDPRVRSLFLNSAIERRYLTLPPEGPDGSRVMEVQGELLAKHKAQAVDMGVRAVQACLKEAGADLADIGYVCCVTTTGFLTPGLSALVIRELGIDPHTSRLDVVGMGCNAGLNALNAVNGWARANPGRLALMVCAEACSAAYVFDGTMRTSVVNSLFGDGSAAVALVAGETAGVGVGAHDGARVPGGAGAPGEAPAAEGPQLLKFSSYIITDAIDAMRYDWDDEQERFSFFLDPHVPYVVGAHAELVVDRLLDGTGLRRSDIDHWLVHSGGKKVIDAVGVNLGLTRHDLRHTTSVLRDYGNLSSGSFLFSYQRLLEEQVAQPGDHGVLMTMGPGSTIETALARW